MYRYPDFPDQVYVELTNTCNARCTVCATADMRRKRETMPLPLFQKIIDECGQRRARKILPFLHGESLLVPGVVDYFRYIRRAAPQAHLNLTTNGSKLSPDVAETFLTEDLLDSLIVSVDGANRETFERIRRGLNFDEVRNNVRHFVRRRRQLGKSLPTVSLSMVNVGQSRRMRREFRDAWREADDVRFAVFFNWAGKMDGAGRSRHKVNFCERIQHYVTILVDGRVALCCFDCEAEFVLGDVGRRSIYEVWHSQAFDEKRRWLYERNFDRMRLCARCDYINHPAWTTWFIRLRPRMQMAFPRFTDRLEKLYKWWMMR